MYAELAYIDDVFGDSGGESGQEYRDQARSGFSWGVLEGV